MDKQFANSPCKRQRLDNGACCGDVNANREEVWFDEGTFSEENLAHIDAMVSQRSQSTSSKVGGEDAANAPSSLAWTASGVVPETGQEAVALTITTKPQTTTIKTWNTPLVGASMQEQERQKQEFKRCRQEKIDDRKAIESLREKLAHKELDFEKAKREKNLIQQQMEILMDERNQADKRAEKLQKELDFMKQEATASKWPSSQVSQQPAKISVPVSKPQGPQNRSIAAPVAKTAQLESAVTSKAKANHHDFPTSSSFVKRLNVAENASDCRSAERNGAVGKRMKTMCHVETGPGLMALLLSKHDNDFHADSILVELLKKHSFASESCDLLPDSGIFSRSTSASTRSSGSRLHPFVDFKFGLLKLLKDDDGASDSRDQFAKKPDGRHSCAIRADVLKTRLGLRDDCATELLRSIEDTLGFLECAKQLVNLKTEQSLPSIGHGPSAHSWITGTTTSSSSGLSSNSESKNSVSLFLRVKAALKLLQVIVYYSSNVRHCLMTEFDVNQPVPSSMDSRENSTQRFILTKLMKFCEQSAETENQRTQELLIVILDIFTAVASYCSVEQLPSFQPILSLALIQNCATLALSGTVLLQLLKLLTKIFASSSIVAATICIQDDLSRRNVCLWKPLMETWKRAVNELPLEFIKQIDLQMIILLTVCCAHEEVTPSFLTSEECHCPFEVTTLLILFLDRQRRFICDIAEETNSRSNDFLRKGISLLLRVVQLDKNFSDHRQSVHMEFIAFLYWLPQVQRCLALGKAADGDLSFDGNVGSLLECGTSVGCFGRCIMLAYRDVLSRMDGIQVAYCKPDYISVFRMYRGIY